MTRLLVKQLERKKEGRPPALSEAQKDAIEKRLEELIRKAAGEWRVSAEMLKTSLRLKVTVRALLEALHDRGYYWHTMRQKPLLTAQDIVDRFQFATDYSNKPAQWWVEKVDMVIDVKYFKIYLNKAARSRAANQLTSQSTKQAPENHHRVSCCFCPQAQRSVAHGHRTLYLCIKNATCYMLFFVFQPFWVGLEPKAILG